MTLDHRPPRMGFNQLNERCEILFLYPGSSSRRSESKDDMFRWDTFDLLLTDILGTVNRKLSEANVIVFFLVSLFIFLSTRGRAIFAVTTT